MRLLKGNQVLKKLVTAFAFLLLLQVVNVFQNVKSSSGNNLVERPLIEEEPSSVHFVKRSLATAARAADQDEYQESNYIEVSRLRPRKGALSSNSQLQKMVQDQGQVMSNMESRRQDLYLELLRKRGQLVNDDSGASILVSLAQLPLRMPRTLKNKKFSEWLSREKVWANVTHFPWSLDEQCNFYSIQFGRNLPMVGLVSYPSSGNTWLRYLLEGASGYFTGSMYNDVSIVNKGYYGEGVPYDSGMTLAVKSHGFTTGNFSLRAVSPTTSEVERRQHNHIKELNSTAIVLIRNPFRAIIGHRHLDEGGHTGHAKEESFLGPGWDRFVSIKIQSWEYFYTVWLTTEQSVSKVVHFENLKDTMEWNLLRLLDFLQLEADAQRIQCLMRHEEGLFLRKKKQAKSKLKEDPFTNEQKRKIRAAINRLNRLLKSKGKESLPLHKYDFY